VALWLAAAARLVVVAVSRLSGDWPFTLYIDFALD
jgi:hypothetical protein